MYDEHDGSMQHHLIHHTRSLTTAEVDPELKWDIVAAMADGGYRGRLLTDFGKEYITACIVDGTVRWG